MRFVSFLLFLNKKSLKEALLNKKSNLRFLPTKDLYQKSIIKLEVGSEYDIKEIYYVDIKYDRKNNTEKYIELLRLLDGYLPEEKTIYVPDVYFVKSGNIIGHNNDTATFEEVEVEQYYTEENRAILKQRLINYIKQIKPAVCNDETKECT